MPRDADAVEETEVDGSDISAAMPGNARGNTCGESGADEDDVVVIVVKCVDTTCAALFEEKAKADEFNFLLTPPDGGCTSTDDLKGSVRGDEGEEAPIEELERKVSADSSVFLSILVTMLPISIICFWRFERRENRCRKFRLLLSTEGSLLGSSTTKMEDVFPPLRVSIVDQMSRMSLITL